MDSLRKEIEHEMKLTRLDKSRLYDILLRIVDNTHTGNEGPPGRTGPPGSQGPPGPQGGRGHPGECKCKCVVESTPEPSSTKKVVTKKKVVSA
jgi:hypothetical protein